MTRSFIYVFFLVFPIISTYGQRNLRLSASPPGYFNLTEAYVAKGLSYTTTPFSASTLGFTTINGYKVDENFRTGVGVGYYAYNGGGLIPLFLDLRYSFRATPLNYKQIQSGKSKPSFFLYADGGYLINPQNIMYGTRMMLNPGVGFMKPITELISASFSIGIMTQMGDGLPKSSFLNTKIGLHFQ
jgi:hypothetical protein